MGLRRFRLNSDDQGATNERVRSYKMGYTVAVVGATGNVGREVLSIMAERNFQLMK